MIDVDIPGHGSLHLHSLVLDFNGTIAVDGALLPGARERLGRLAELLSIHVVTADTFGLATEQLRDHSFCSLTILPAADQTQAKLDYVRRLDARGVAAMGNGRNDARMLKEAALGVVVVQGEGAALETILAADVVCPDIAVALDLLLNPLRLKATLRS